MKLIPYFLNNGPFLKIEYFIDVKCIELNCLDSQIKMENMLEDLKYYGEEGTIIKTKVNVASDVWIEYDKPKYENDEIFKELICAIQKRKDLPNA